MGRPRQLHLFPLLLTAVVVVSGFAFFLFRERPTAASNQPSSPGGELPNAPEAPASRARGESNGTSQGGSGSSRSTVVAAAPPPGCPEDPEDPPTLVRPSTFELLRLRTMELRDRLPLISREGSEELRRGLASLGDDRPDLDALYRAPDRVRDGFDVAVAATLHLGIGALAGDPERARRLAERATRAAPDDAEPRLLAAIAARRLHLYQERVDALQAADALLPDEPAIALALARAYASVGRFAEASVAARAYVAEQPDDLRMRGWASRMERRGAATAAFVVRRRAGIEVRHDPATVDSELVDAVIEEARGALGDAARLLLRARRPELVVIVYENRTAMQRATCTPSWTGGVFDGVLHLDAQTLAGPGWRRVVRHESVHAQIALLRRRVPTWLNEGLAQHLEGELRPAARASWERMVERELVIPFPSLEGALVVIDDAGDAQLAYHQSLAMVRFMMERRGARVIRDAADLIEAGEGADLLHRLVPDADGDALLAYLAVGR